jgi:hypothetical protein
MFVSLVFEMQISIEFAPLRRYQSRRERKEQLDDGIGDTFVSVFSSRVDLGTGVDTKVLPIPSSNCAAHCLLAE